MSSSIADADRSVVVLVDMQPTFLRAICEEQRVRRRCEFLLRIARLLGIPIVATEQNRERMGGTDDSLRALLEREPAAKMSFSCAGCEEFEESLLSLRREQAVIVGIETHICVSQTALSLASKDFETFVCPDAAGARSEDRHEAGLRRMELAGVSLAHSEAIAYEWMGSASHGRFREALEIVKSFGA